MHFLRAFAAAVSTLVWIAAATSQSITIATHAPSGGRVSHDLYQPPLVGAFPGGTLTLPASVQLQPPYSAALLAQLSPVATTDVVGVTYDLSVSVSVQLRAMVTSQTWDGSAHAPQAFRVVLQPDPSTVLQGTLRVSASGGAQAIGMVAAASATNELDLDGDAVPDVSLPVPYGIGESTTWVREIPLTLHPGQPRSLTLWSAARASAYSTATTASAWCKAEITFASGQAATSVELGSVCGAAIAGWYEREERMAPEPFVRRTAQVSLHGAPSLSPALLLIGLDRIQTAIPGTPCALHTTPLVALPLCADALGRAELRIGVPAAASGAASFQFLALGAGPALSLMATPGLSLLMR